MRRFALVFMATCLFSTTAMAIDIACSTEVSWWPEATAQQEMEEIAESVPVPVEIFTSSDGDALADWVIAHTGNGQSDLLILSGRFPTSIYPGGNAQPDGSLAELFLDDGNCIINTGDWMFYVSNPNNGADGLANMMDIPGISMSDPIVDVTPTAEAELYTPSFEGFSPSRPWHLEQITGDWQIELILGQNADGTRADPAIMVNTVTGGRLGTFYQVADVLTDIRSVVISEWINNWYLPTVALAPTATKPAPAGGAIDVPREVVLGWQAGPEAVTHDVYFGASFEDVNAASRSNPLDVLVSQDQPGTTFDPTQMLDFETTYYWRVDEVNGAPDFTIFKGDVWSFTTEPFAYAVENIVATSNVTSEEGSGPEETINGSGLDADDEHSTESDDMWLGLPAADETASIQYEFDRVYKLHQMLVWNYNVQFELILGFGVKDATVEYSENGTDWTVLGDVQLNQATARPTYVANTTVDFGGVAARYVRLTVNSGFGTLPQYGLSEVRFMYIPAHPRQPEPADGAADVSVDSTLTWRAGRDAVSHEVYLGTDPEALALADTVETAAYVPAELNLDTTYYWQVNAIQETEAWEGALWSFDTQDYIVVDDFESYDDDIDAGTTIFDTWLDGWVNETGSTVGYFEAPFAEREIVHSGRQAMPLFYDNSETATSETDLELDADWSGHGIQSLSLYFHGAEGNTGQLYVEIDGTRIDYDGPAINLVRPAWQLWSIDLSQVGNVSDVTSLTIGIEGAGATGVIYIDDIRLYPEVLDTSSPDVTGAGDAVQGVPNDGDWPAAETPDLAIDDNTATKFLHFKGSDQPTGIQVTPLVGATVVTGLTLTTANDAPERDPISFEVYGSNAGIDGPYTLIASGDVPDFAGATAWPRFTKNTTPIEFENSTAYLHYQVLFPTVRNATAANSMQIAEIELIGSIAP